MTEKVICRTCNGHDGVLGLQEIDETSEKIFNKLFIALIGECQSLPKFICTKCHEKLLELNDFYEQVLSCIETHKKCVTEELIKVEKEEAEEIFDPGDVDDSSSEDTAKDLPKRRRRGKMIKSDVIREDKELENFYDLSCPHCAKTPDSFVQFSTFRQFSGHLKETHDVKVPYILCCKKKLFKRSELLDHLNYHKHPEKYQCPLCQHQCYDIYQLRKHSAKCEGPETPEEFKCDKCPLTFPSKNTLNSHRNVHLTREEKNLRRIHACDRCSVRFTSIYALKRHFKERHEGGFAFLCHGCAKPFYSKSDFLTHYKSIHASITKIKCPECDSMLKHERALRRHLRNIHQSKGKWICNICNKETPTIEALRSHERYSHSDAAVKLHECNLCEKKFKKLVTLREHMTTHYDDAKKQHGCQFCEKSFNSSANMIKHRKRMHPDV